MAVSDLYFDSCTYCHSVKWRVEHVLENDEWTEIVMCANCFKRKL